MTPRGFRLILIRSKTGSLLFTLFFLAIACFASTRWCQAETTVSASLHPASFTVDRGTILTVTVNGSGSSEIQLPVVAGVSFQGRGRSTQMQIVNGSLSSSVSYTYQVEVEHPGTYTLPPISVSVDGSTLTTRPITFEVTAAGGTSSRQGGTAAPSTDPSVGGNEKVAFLRISEIKGTSWAGESIPVRITAYSRQGIKVRLNTLPVLKGNDFVIPQLDQHPRQTEETVNGTLYSVLTWESSISAVKEGQRTLSVELEATLLFPHRRTPFPGFGDQDAFQDDIFQNFFGGFESKNIKVASQPISIEVKQLPTDHQPHDFSGAIGHFNLLVEAKPTKVEVGDPITLDMTVAGEGNFDRVETPKFSEDPKWKTYPPSAEFKEGEHPTQGKKHFEQAIVVKDDQVTEIPPVSFVYFDPATEQYVTLTSPPIPLSVKRGQAEDAAAKPSTSASPVPATQKREPKGQTIAGLAPNHLHMGGLQRKIIPLYARQWFVLLLALCTLMLLAVFLWKARLKYLRNNPEVRQKKEMQELFAKNMAEIRQAAENNDSGKYLGACRTAIREILGRYWQIEPSIITLADLQARLPPSSSLIVLFTAAEQGAYAKHTLSAAQIRQYSEQIEKELAELL
ncbi:MAG: BatD family protein [Desulfobulbus sp.]